MVLRILKSNRSVNYILFPLLALAFWARSLMNPTIYPFFLGETENPLYEPIARLVGHSAMLQTVLSLILIILLAFLVQLVNNRYDFIRIRTMLPASLYVIMVSGFTQMHTLHPVYFAAIFTVLALYRLFGAFDKNKPYSSAFDTGFLLGIGTLFYFNLFVLLPAFLIGIAIVARDVRWREFVLMLIGFLLPLIFALSYGFYTGRLQEFYKTFEGCITTPNSHFRSNLPLQVFLSSLIILTFIGSVKIIQQFDYKKVSTRKYFSVFFLVFVFTLLSFIFIPATSEEILLITAIPLTFLISNFFVFLKSRFWGELLFSVLLIIVVVLQFLA